MTRVARSIVVLFASAVVSGCFSFSQPAPEFREYDLTYPVAAIERPRLDVVVAIPGFGVTAIYDREAILYRRGANRLGRYYYDRWATNPGDMIADLLARDFAESDAYRAVVHQRSVLAADFQLTGDVEVIEERTTADGCVADLQLRFLLIRRGSDDGGVVLRPSFDVARPCACGEPSSLAEALNAALAEISAALQSQVYDAIAAQAGIR